MCEREVRGWGWGAEWDGWGHRTGREARERWGGGGGTCCVGGKQGGQDGADGGTLREEKQGKDEVGGGGVGGVFGVGEGGGKGGGGGGRDAKRKERNRAKLQVLVYATLPPMCRKDRLGEWSRATFQASLSGTLPLWRTAVAIELEIGIFLAQWLSHTQDLASRHLPPGRRMS